MFESSTLGCLYILQVIRSSLLPFILFSSLSSMYILFLHILLFSFYLIFSLILLLIGFGRNYMKRPDSLVKRSEKNSKCKFYKVKVLGKLCKALSCLLFLLCTLFIVRSEFASFSHLSILIFGWLIVCSFSFYFLMFDDVLMIFLSFTLKYFYRKWI